MLEAIKSFFLFISKIVFVAIMLLFAATVSAALRPERPYVGHMIIKEAQAAESAAAPVRQIVLDKSAFLSMVFVETIKCEVKPSPKEITMSPGGTYIFRATCNRPPNDNETVSLFQGGQPFHDVSWIFADGGTRIGSNIIRFNPGSLYAEGILRIDPGVEKGWWLDIGTSIETEGEGYHVIAANFYCVGGGCSEPPDP